MELETKIDNVRYFIRYEYDSDDKIVENLEAWDNDDKEITIKDEVYPRLVARADDDLKLELKEAGFRDAEFY